MSLPFEILPHTADIRIRALGQTRQELFQNMLRGMFHDYEPERTASRVERYFAVASPDFSALLVDLLSEALTLADIYNEVYDEVSFARLSDTECSGKLSGWRLKGVQGEEIKAVTYHDMKLEKKKDETWEAEVVFDI